MLEVLHLDLSMCSLLDYRFRESVFHCWEGNPQLSQVETVKSKPVQLAVHLRRVFTQSEIHQEHLHLLPCVRYRV
jgi:hypothetical protein